MPNGPTYHNSVSHLPAHYGNHRDKRAETVRVLLLVLSTISLAIALLSVLMLAYEVITHQVREMLQLFFVQGSVAAITFIIGWVLALVGTRKYNNLVIPLVINFYAWCVVLATCVLYAFVIARLTMHNYYLEKYVAYWGMLIVGFGVLIALHLIPEGHRLAPFAYPIFTVSLIHLIVIVIHYVFLIRQDTTLNMEYIGADILIFFAVLGFGLMVLFDMPFLYRVHARLDRLWGRKKMLD